jgi:hypothetical protein
MPQIYESPDDGKTVYVREVGSKVKKLHYVSPVEKEEMKDVLLRQEWSDIRHAAKENPTLQKSVDQLIMLYRLMKNNGDSKT